MWIIIKPFLYKALRGIFSLENATWLLSTYYLYTNNLLFTFLVIHSLSFFRNLYVVLRDTDFSEYQHSSYLNTFCAQFLYIAELLLQKNKQKHDGMHSLYSILILALKAVNAPSKINKNQRPTIHVHVPSSSSSSSSVRRKITPFLDLTLMPTPTPTSTPTEKESDNGTVPESFPESVPDDETVPESTPDDETIPDDDTVPDDETVPETVPDDEKDDESTPDNETIPDSVPDDETIPDSVPDDETVPDNKKDD
jgi:hypothetical protein